MLVVTFSLAGRRNCAAIAGTPYVYATVDGEGFVMRAQCPHRGGPLHLAHVAGRPSRLVCPWHERKTSLARLRAEIPAVRVGSSVTAVFPAGEGAEVSLEHRPLSPELSPRHPRPEHQQPQSQECGP